MAHAVEQQLATRVRTIQRELLDPIAQRTLFARRLSDREIADEPTVLVLGNHSSGKSSFINFLLGERVQKTGLAPTDDGFTILRHSAVAEDRDGAAVVTDPELGFDGLEHFGPGFTKRLRLKGRPLEALERITVVDSPGMIDSPGSSPETSDRGYDFIGAVRWFAERADLILLFFDPDKPGTTGETLAVLTRALCDLEHKLMIVLNKVDQFRSLSDFARAYGALCWNLGKVLATKDLPLIYTTFVPVPEAGEPWALAERFASTRDEVVREVLRTPQRHLDNLVTELGRRAEALHMYASVLDAAVRRARRYRRAVFATWAFVSALAFGGAWWAWSGAGLGRLSVALSVLALLVVVGGFALVRWRVRERVRALRGELDRLFATVYAEPLMMRERAADLRATWQSVRPRIERVLHERGVFALRPVRRRELRRLASVASEQVRELRAWLHRSPARRQAPAAAAGEPATAAR
ncbi:MAG: GTPase [Planctomycetota bacterium]|nr:MAG: GTPase [Planctomycetota bacterium]